MFAAPVGTVSQDFAKLSYCNGAVAAGQVPTAIPPPVT